MNDNRVQVFPLTVVVPKVRPGWNWKPSSAEDAAGAAPEGADAPEAPDFAEAVEDAGTDAADAAEAAGLADDADGAGDTEGLAPVGGAAAPLVATEDEGLAVSETDLAGWAATAAGACATGAELVGAADGVAEGTLADEAGVEGACASGSEGRTVVWLHSGPESMVRVSAILVFFTAISIVTGGKTI